MTGPKLDDVPSAVAHAVAEALGDAYDCTRAWSAWRHGTMEPSDFHPVADDGDRVAEIALAAIIAWEASKPQPAPAIDLEKFRPALEHYRRDLISDYKGGHITDNGAAMAEADRLLALIDGQSNSPGSLSHSGRVIADSEDVRIARIIAEKIDEGRLDHPGFYKNGRLSEALRNILALIDGQAEPRIDLAADHTGMLVDYSGLIGSAQRALLDDPGIAEMLRQLCRHLEELGRRWYAGDRKVVDEFLQLYCIESEARAALVKRPTKGEGVVTAPRGPDQPDLCDLCRVRDEVRTDADGIPFCQECWDGWQASEQPTKGEEE